ncbi:MAG: hypothetical protein MUO77_21320 [Anaerolineales bacterium]|nr:hypothetical protein [Anaerolineales bacterium]
MTSSLNVLVTRDELLYLSKRTAGQPTAISPFAKMQNVEAVQRVPSAALANPDGSVRAEVTPALDTLTKAQSLGFVSYSGGEAGFEASVYYPAAGQPAALMVNQDGYRLQSPPYIADWITTLGQLVGESIVKSVEVEWELDIQEAWILFGIIDGARRQILKRLAENNRPETILIPVGEIAQNLKGENPQWLAPYFAASHELPEMNESETLAILQTLAQKGLATIDGEKIKPSDKLIETASAFLTLEGHLRLQASVLNDEFTAANTLIWGVQGRGKAVLMWTSDKQGVSIFSVSPAQAMVIIGSVLEAPAAQFTDAALPKAPAAPTSMPAAKIQTPVENIPAADSPKASRKRKILIILGIVFICACLAFGAFALYIEYFS